MLTRRVSMLMWVAAAVLAGVLTGLQSHVPAQEVGQTLQVAIPSTVNITIDQHLVIVTGKSAGISPVTYAPGTPNPHSVVIVDPQSGQPAQHSEILIYGLDEVGNGTRLRIIGGGTVCTPELKLFTGSVE